MIYAVLTVILAYLLGSISFAVILSKIFLKKDVREMGSGNAGTTNVMRTGGFKLGALTFLGDVLKGLVACLVGKLVFKAVFESGDEWAVYGAFLCGIACMIGHMLPIFFQFKGGKGIATSVGIFAICCWPSMVIGLSVFAIGVLITRIVSLSSIFATFAVVSSAIIFSYINDPALFWPQAVLASLMGVLVIVKHGSNIKRLLNGTEKKLTIGGKK